MQGHSGKVLYPEEQLLPQNGPLCSPLLFQLKRVCRIRAVSVVMQKAFKYYYYYTQFKSRWCLHREFPMVRSEQERPVLYLGPRPPDAALHHTVSPRCRDGAALCLSWRSVGFRSLRSCPHPHFISQLFHRNALDIAGPQPAWWENFLSIDNSFISGSHAG